MSCALCQNLNCWIGVDSHNRDVPFELEYSYFIPIDPFKLRDHLLIGNRRCQCWFRKRSKPVPERIILRMEQIPYEQVQKANEITEEIQRVFPYSKDDIPF